MCLVVDSLRTRKNYTFKKKKFYKVLLLSPFGTLVSPIYHKGWICGFNKADITQGKEITDYSGVEHGIHVFSNKKQAKHLCKHVIQRVLVEVYCNAEDLVAFGKYGDAVFNQVYLTRAEFRRAKKEVRDAIKSKQNKRSARR